LFFPQKKNGEKMARDPWKELGAVCQLSDTKVDEIRAFFAAEKLIVCERNSVCACPVFSPYVHDNFGRRASRLICRNETCIQCGDRKQDVNYKPYCGHDCHHAVWGEKGDY
jgi:hypothetical protein